MTVSEQRHPPLDSPPTKPCHNCRRRRLRCDRSLPACRKCHARGEACLGYGQLLRWTNSVAVRGKLALQIPQRLQPPLVDPLLQDLGPRNRFYLNHFNQLVCPALVSSVHQAEDNPFRCIVTLLAGFNYLREIILATSAVHVVALQRNRGNVYRQELVDALTAKGKAYRFLRRALDRHGDSAADRAFIMIAVIFFVNFDLIDSGRGKWRTHVEAAGNMIASLQKLGTPLSSALPSALPSCVARLADTVVADCTTYYILGSLFAPANDLAIPAFDSIDIPATLQRVEAISYICCPPLVLDSLRKASTLPMDDVSRATSLTETLRDFDVRAWVYSIPGLLPDFDDELDLRVSIAGAHRSAACLYIALAVPSSTTAEDWADEILACLAAVPADHQLAKGAIWPMFMAGAQAADWATRQWCLGRMRAVIDDNPSVCPWGYVDSAVEDMRRIWAMRDANMCSGKNWLHAVRENGDQCLII